MPQNLEALLTALALSGISYFENAQMCSIKEGGIHESSDLPDLRGAVVVRKVWLLPPVPSRSRAAGGHSFATEGRQSYSAFPGSIFLVPNTPEFKRGHAPNFEV